MFIFCRAGLHHGPLVRIFLLPKPIPALPHTANPKPGLGSALANILQTTMSVILTFSTYKGLSERLPGLPHFHKTDLSFGWDVSWHGAVCRIGDQLSFQPMSTI